MKNKLILVRGVPGSGKSTLAKLLANTQDVDHFEADMYFESTGVYKYVPEEIHLAHRWCQEETEYSLDIGRTVVVSNTFTTIRELRPYFEIADKFGIVPQVITCQNDYGNIHSVPDEVMTKMKSRFTYDISPLFSRDVAYA